MTQDRAFQQCRFIFLIALPFGAFSSGFNSRGYRWLFSGIGRKVLLISLLSSFAVIQIEVVLSTFLGPLSESDGVASVGPGLAQPPWVHRPGPRPQLPRRPAHRRGRADRYRHPLSSPPLFLASSPALCGRPGFTSPGPDPGYRATAGRESDTTTDLL
jgi:hypothetical protein